MTNHLSLKENYLRALRGEVPEYVPRSSMFFQVRPDFFNGDRVGGVGKDIYGVEWVIDDSAIAAAIPKPNDYILDDICNWRDVIKFPDLSDLDWEAMSKKDIEGHNPEYPRSCRIAHGGYFQTVMNFLGFTNGLLALYEEPEEVKALINYLCDEHLKIADKLLQYYQPDFVTFGDDIATERNTFVSIDTFHDIFEPVWRRNLKYYKDRGYLASHHNCGKVESFIDDIVDMGFNAWDPAQISNDLAAIKKRHNSKLLIVGGFDSRTLMLPHLEFSEEEIRTAVRDTMNTLAPGGGYCFPGVASQSDDDPKIKQRADWINDEYEQLKFSYS